MRPIFLHRRRLFPVVGGAVAVSLLWTVPGVSMLLKAGSTLVGATLGIFAGQSVWRKTQKNIYAKNRVTLYYTDSFTYTLLFMAGLASLMPGPALRGVLIVANHPVVLGVILLGLASLGLMMSLVIYWQIRRHELKHGPLQAKWLYSQSTTGAEGMLGKSAVVEAVRGTEGTVRVGSELWLARPLDEFALHVGESVLVREVDGLCLLVEHTKSGSA